MQAEIANHEPRVNAVFENGQKLISEGHPEADKYERDLNNLTEKWARLQDLLEARRQKLLVNERVQQFLFDANEAESWMSEQELYIMVEDRGKDEFSAQNLMKKHEILETSVEDYAETVRQLGETARQLISDGHPESEAVAGSHELGQDYEHVTLLVERFKEFAKETDSIGSERVAAVNEIADSLISVGHTDAATIAQWKDSLNDAW